MQINKARFVTSIADYSTAKVENIPQIALIGRSNVGKSSLINYLCNNKKLAKVSSSPGKTRLINLFKINGIRSGKSAIKIEKEAGSIMNSKIFEFKCSFHTA